MEEAVTDRLARLAARYDTGNGEAEAMTKEAIERLAYRRRHSGKTCSRCGEDKPLSAFASDSRRPDGLAYSCKQCEATRKRLARVNVL
ncbi:HNH endonuclease [Arthrobacter phage VResidence]|uniref:HNH endonuclease n=1 Tax=Arthrobacter phage VResidence TaxID=2927294 RepID=A0A9X9P635_9CAUD|nr:HNH endonuclease [Arthrobacter phage VResidence]